MSIARALPRRIVVAGDGQVGVLAAVALRQALPSCDVVVLGVDPDPAALADRIGTALPFTNRLHDRLGIDEEQLVRQCGASHRLVMHYLGWGGESHQGMAAYGAALDPRLKTAFAKEWGGGPRNAQTGVTAGSVAEALAQAGKFMPPDGQPGSPLADLDYALRWNVPAYRDLLIGLAQQAGVQYARGRIAGVESDGQGGVAALTIEGAGVLAADLYLDCTGPRALLLAQMPDYRRQDWSGMLPLRRLAVSPQGEPMVSLADRLELTPLGWAQQLAGRDGQLTLLGLAPDTDEAQIAALFGGTPPAMLDLQQGRAERSWLGNVVALGDSAAHFEPLGWYNLDLAHRQIELLLDLLPGQAVDPRERAEFNRRAAMMADRVRDVIACHYAAPRAAAMFGPVQFSPEMTITLDQYARRARLPFFEEMPLLSREWGSLLAALGVPCGTSAVERSADPEQGKRAAQVFARKCEAALRATPPYSAWLQQALQG